MKAGKKYLSVLMVLAGLGSAYGGDLRIWTDKSGATIEAEYIRMQDNRVLLKKADGTEIKVSLDTLNERDRNYVILQSPPRLAISVSPKTIRSNTGYNRGVQITDELVSVRATIKKSSSTPYEAALNAELYILGSKSKKDGYIILDKKTSTFGFSPENSNTHTMDSSEVNLKQVQMGVTKGVQYVGYVLAVKDATGAILEVKANKNEFSKNAEAILESSKGTIFDGEFKKIEKKDKPDNRKGVQSDRRLGPGKRY